MATADVPGANPANQVREFSPYLNASDLLAKFVQYVGGLGVKQAEVLGLPLELFINWLVIEAAERDQDPLPPDVVPVPQHRAFREIRKPRCRACGRYVPAARRILPFCNVEHGTRYLEQWGRDNQKLLEAKSA